MKVIPEFGSVVPYLQTLPFLVSMLVLYFVLFKPLLAYMEERNHATAGARHHAATLQGEIAARLTELEQRLAAARDESRNVRQAARDRALAQEAAAVAAARAQAGREVDSAVKALAVEGEAARASLHTLAVSLSRDIVVAVLGRNTHA